MTQAGLHAGRSPLDEAHEKRLEGEAEEALRRAVALLDTVEDLGAASLAAQLLAEAGRPAIARELAERLVDSFIRRGDLPEAVVASMIVDKAEGDGKKLRRDIAAAWGAGSNRHGTNVAQAPPPLPHGGDVTDELARASGKALIAIAEKKLRDLLEVTDIAAADALVPALPLFSALAPRPLARLLDKLQLRDFATGDVLVLQGEEGREAFVVVRGAAEVRRDDGSSTGPGTVLAALGPGAIFGEMALVSDSPRAASVIALEPTRVLVASREALEEIAQDEPVVGRELGEFCRSRMIANLMRHSVILRAVAPSDRSALISRFVSRTFEAGTTLVKEGQEGAGLYLIASGQVDVTRKDSEGDRLRLATLGPGDVVGEISLVLRRPATADAVASHHTVALELSRESFQEAIRTHPQLLSELYDLAVRREEETRSVVAQEALDVEDVVIL